MCSIRWKALMSELEQIWTGQGFDILENCLYGGAKRVKQSSILQVEIAKPPKIGGLQRQPALAEAVKALTTDGDAGIAARIERILAPAAGGFARRMIPGDGRYGRLGLMTMVCRGLAKTIPASSKR
jgi:hypothetical protein